MSKTPLRMELHQKDWRWNAIQRASATAIVHKEKIVCANGWITNSVLTVVVMQQLGDAEVSFLFKNILLIIFIVLNQFNFVSYC